MLRAFSLGRFAVTLLVVLAGSILWIYEWINNSLNYTGVVARVERIESVCAPAGTPPAEATDCRNWPARVNGKKVVMHRVARLRYKSPADSAEHSGTIFLHSGVKSANGKRLQAGDDWKILAHDDQPLVIKPR